jgi:hypothetical protein
MDVLDGSKVASSHGKRSISSVRTALAAQCRGNDAKLLIGGRVRSSKITADVRAFFTSYCTAFIRQDSPAIARHFADLVHVASDRGDDVSVHVADSVEWRKTIDRILEMYRAIDVGSVEATGLAIDALSPRLVQARLRWALSDRASKPLYEFDAMYTLARHTETFRITALAVNEIPEYRSCLARLGQVEGVKSGTDKRP